MISDLAKLGDAGMFVDPYAYADLDSWHAAAARLRANDLLPFVELEEYVPFRAVTRHADAPRVSFSWRGSGTFSGRMDPPDIDHYVASGPYSR
jgi:hypothetical protein